VAELVTTASNLMQSAYIDVHLAECIRVADLTEMLDLIESHFCRAFRCSFGTSAHEYVTRRRIEVAQSLMLGSREPLSEIALRCGLCDRSHFIRVFRQTVGETLDVWRRAAGRPPPRVSNGGGPRMRNAEHNVQRHTTH
jgi:AraC-like DNA-binding protein